METVITLETLNAAANLSTAGLIAYVGRQLRAMLREFRAARREVNGETE